MAGTHDAPQSANEALLQNMLGEDNEIREPQSRIEELLLELLEQGGGVLPEIESGDEGKVLAVVEGAWDKAELPEGNLPIVTDADNGDLLGVTGGAWGKVNPENVTVGNAEQIVSKIAVEDRAPYNFRTAGGALEIGDRVRVSEITGATVAWNQLVRNGNFADTNNWTPQDCTFSVENNVATLTPSSATYRISTSIPIVEGHKYLRFMTVKGTEGVASLSWYGALLKDVTLNGTVQRVEDIINNTYASGNWVFQILGRQNTGLSPLDVMNVGVCDLTLAFGSAIADRAYTMEQSTAGSGIAWLKSYGFFTKDYYAYNAGSLESVVTSEHITTEFNQWDEEWELGLYDTTTGNKSSTSTQIRCKNLIEVDPNKSYHATVGVGGMWAVFFDADKNVLYRPLEGQGLTRANNAYQVGNATSPISYFTVPRNCHYMAFYMTNSYGTTYNNDICINLHWDGERDGEYEPYADHVYPLDSSVELRGILKLDADNNIVADGDRHKPDGSVTRPYGIVDLGTLTWTYSSPNLFTASPPNIATVVVPPYSNRQAGAICSKYAVDPQNAATASSRTDKTWLRVTNKIYIKDSAYTDAATFKAAMNGVYLVYELATPTTESAEPYQETQIVDNWGTEQYTDYAYEQGTRDVEIPVPSVAYYPVDLRAKIEAAPDSPTTDGYYLMKRENGENSYSAYTDGGRITAIENKLPDPPTEAGQYILKATVAAGTVTYEWVNA